MGTGEIERSLTFGVVPHTDEPGAELMLDDYCSLLGLHAGVNVQPHRSRSPAELAEAFMEDRLDLAWVSPSLFLMSNAFEHATPLVSSLREGVAGYHGVLFVVEDAPIGSLMDLTGKRAAWVAPTSAAGYIFPRLVMGNCGLDPRTTLAHEAFLGTHGAVARAVADGQADVGATFAVFEQGDPAQPLKRAGFDEQTSARFRVLIPTDRIPSDLVVLSPRVAPAVRDALKTALLGLPHDGPLAEATREIFGADGYCEFDAEPMRRLEAELQAGRQLGLV